MRPGRGVGSGVAVKLMGDAGKPPPSAWRTPTPYVFLSLLVMMLVIAVSLLVLICTRRRAPSSSSSDDEKAAAEALALAPLDREPKVVVFMPGDHDTPSFLASAKPLAGR